MSTMQVPLTEMTKNKRTKRRLGWQCTGIQCQNSTRTQRSSSHKNSQNAEKTQGHSIMCRIHMRERATLEAVKCLHSWDAMMSDRCEIIKIIKKKKPKPERKAWTNWGTQGSSMPRKNAELLHRISVFEGNAEAIGKLFKKEKSFWQRRYKKSWRKPHSQR